MMPGARSSVVEQRLYTPPAAGSIPVARTTGTNAALTVNDGAEHFDPRNGPDGPIRPLESMGAEYLIVSGKSDPIVIVAADDGRRWQFHVTGETVAQYSAREVGGPA